MAATSLGSEMCEEGAGTIDHTHKSFRIIKIVLTLIY